MSAELWVAREVDLPASIALSRTRLRMEDGNIYLNPGPILWLSAQHCPDLAPGECRRVTVTLTLSPAPAPDTRNEGE